MAEEKWITVNGAHIPVGEGGNLQGKVGSKIEQEAELTQKRQSVKNALQEIANGKEEVTLPKLRNDLEQYGGTNDVTLIKGNKKRRHYPYYRKRQRSLLRRYFRCCY